MSVEEAVLDDEIVVTITIIRPVGLVKACIEVLLEVGEEVLCHCVGIFG